jgi:hypothetical protein
VKYLHKSGRAEKAAAEVVDACQDFARFLSGRGLSGPDQGTPADLDAFVDWVESQPGAPLQAGSGGDQKRRRDAVCRG